MAKYLLNPKIAIRRYLQSSPMCHASTPCLNTGISSSKEIPAMTAPQDAASAKTAAIRRVIMRYLRKTVIPGGGMLKTLGRTVSKR